MFELFLHFSACPDVNHGKFSVVPDIELEEVFGERTGWDHRTTDRALHMALYQKLPPDRRLEENQLKNLLKDVKPTDTRMSIDTNKMMKKFAKRFAKKVVEKSEL